MDEQCSGELTRCSCAGSEEEQNKNKKEAWTVARARSRIERGLPADSLRHKAPLTVYRRGRTAIEPVLSELVRSSSGRRLRWVKSQRDVGEGGRKATKCQYSGRLFFQEATKFEVLRHEEDAPGVPGAEWQSCWVYKDEQQETEDACEDKGNQWWTRPTERGSGNRIVHSVDGADGRDANGIDAAWMRKGDTRMETSGEALPESATPNAVTVRRVDMDAEGSECCRHPTFVQVQEVQQRRDQKEAWPICLRRRCWLDDTCHAVNDEREGCATRAHTRNRSVFIYLDALLLTNQFGSSLDPAPSFSSKQINHPSLGVQVKVAINLRKYSKDSVSCTDHGSIPSRTDENASSLRCNEWKCSPTTSEPVLVWVDSRSNLT
ncbi:hypothetical protein DFH06DRAFT_1392396 [Mycena polygramma]|nr:hypothetical protein DFH06DRAFT_1392396 [Mycena polygramma]